MWLRLTCPAVSQSWSCTGSLFTVTKTTIASVQNNLTLEALMITLRSERLQVESWNCFVYVCTCREAEASIRLSQWCISHIPPISTKFINFPPIFILFRFLASPLLWPWCSYTSRLTRTRNWFYIRIGYIQLTVSSWTNKLLLSYIQLSFSDCSG